MLRLFLLNVFSLPSAAATRDKYQQFFPYYAHVFLDALKGPCFANYTAYEESTGGDRMIDLCKYVFDCLVGQLYQHDLANFASAQVLLGLMPGLLSLAASSIGEISMLSSQRPLLSLLLSMGGPAVYQSRTFRYDYPLKTLPLRSSIWTARARKWWMLISAGQYLVALLSITNVMQTSWQLGLRTVVVWKCNSSYLPFLYSILLVVIHLIGAGSWYFSKTMNAVRLTEGNHPNSRSKWIRRTTLGLRHPRPATTATTSSSRRKAHSASF